MGLFGVSLAKASLPTFSYQVNQKNVSQFNQTLISLMGQVFYLAFPFSVFLAVLRVPVVRLVFGADRFGWDATIQTGNVLSAFCLGIFSQALIYILTRAFWALQDTPTPVKISIGSIFLNISLGIIFILGLNKANDSIQ